MAERSAAAPISRPMAIAALLAVASSFAGNHVAARLAFDYGVNVPTAVVLRSVFTALFVFGLLRLGGHSLALPPGRRLPAAAVGLLLTVQSYCLYSAVARIPVALALLAFNTYPFLLGAISWLSGGERPRRSTWIAMGVALVGLALALDVAGRVGSQGAGVGTDVGRRWAEIGAGVGFALGASATFAYALHLTAHRLPDIDGRLRTLVTMSVVAIVTLAAGVGTAGLALPHDAPGWVGLALLMILYAAAITGLFIVLPRVGAVNNAAVMNFEPIASLIMAWVILGQTIAPLQIVGALLVIGAIVALSVAK
ncbi:MAG TPA: DMT family transporter [Burkholderiaceae bacterium]|nr:DMT family transporter [Burkholderiaceae bacterium]